MCSIDGSADRPREEAILGVHMGRPIVTDGKFVALLYKRTCEAIELLFGMVNGV